MDFDTAIYAPNNRYNYGKDRTQALGLIDERLPMLVFTMRADVPRAISLRKANPREVNAMKNKLEPRPAGFDHNPEWAKEDFARARPFRDGHPEVYPAWEKEKNKGGRPPVEQPKVHIGFRLAADVSQAFAQPARATTPASKGCCATRWRKGCCDKRFFRPFSG